MLNELVDRDRMEKVTMWEMTARAIGTFMGHSGDAVNRVISGLKPVLLDRVTQESYNMRVVRARLVLKLQEFRTKGRYMQMLDDMTVGD